MIFGERNAALEYIHKALSLAQLEGAISFQFNRVLGKPCAHRGSGMHNGSGLPHSRQRSAHECIGSLEEMIALVAATRVSQMLHCDSFPAESVSPAPPL